MKFLTITLLLLSVCPCPLATGNHSHSEAEEIFPPCCIRVISANISSDITGDMYEVQNANGRCVEAIIFRSNDGTVCADPKAKWVQNIIANMTAVKL